MSEIGFGCNQYQLAFYVENAPQFSSYATPNSLIELPPGAINEISMACGNGWRKQFNVYAKFIYNLSPSVFSGKTAAPTWQQYRDTQLLQQGSATALLFSPPNYTRANTLHIIAGRGYAKKLASQNLLGGNLTWLNDEFAYNIENKLLVSPFLDYRQLSNRKIDFLAQMCEQLIQHNCIQLERFQLPQL